MDNGTIEFDQIMMIFPVNFLGEPFFNEKPDFFLFIIGFYIGAVINF